MSVRPCCLQANAITGVIGKLHGALSDIGCRAFHVFSAEVCCQVLKVNTCLQPSNLIFSKALLPAFDGQQLITHTHTLFSHTQSFTLTHSHTALSAHSALIFFSFNFFPINIFFFFFLFQIVCTVYKLTKLCFFFPCFYSFRTKVDLFSWYYLNIFSFFWRTKSKKIQNKVIIKENDYYYLKVKRKWYNIISIHQGFNYIYIYLLIFFDQSCLQVYVGGKHRKARLMVFHECTTLVAQYVHPFQHISLLFFLLLISGWREHILLMFYLRYLHILALYILTLKRIH